MVCRKSPDDPRPRRGALGAAVPRCALCALCAACAAVPAARPRAHPAPPVVRRYTADVIATHPHDPDAFTQGLEFYNGMLLESTGLQGYSSLRVVDVASGRVLRRRAVAPEHYAEGLTVFGGRIYQLTYRSQRCFVYDAATLEPVAEHAYPGEGWGLTHDARALIMSDGTARLRFLDPATFAEQRAVTVRDGDAPVERLNELEMVEGELLANVWMSDRIARIDPATGRVLGWIELGFLRRGQRPEEPQAVLNGIAYEPATRRLLVTGKLWSAMFEIRIRALDSTPQEAR